MTTKKEPKNTTNVRFNLEDMMWRKRVPSINQLSKETKISLPTLYKIKNNNQVLIHLETIETLCNYFDCEVNDLIVYKREGQAVSQ